MATAKLAEPGASTGEDRSDAPDALAVKKKALYDEGMFDDILERFGLIEEEVAIEKENEGTIAFKDSLLVHCAEATRAAEQFLGAAFGCMEHYGLVIPITTKQLLRLSAMLAKAAGVAVEMTTSTLLLGPLKARQRESGHQLLLFSSAVASDAYRAVEQAVGHTLAATASEAEEDFSTYGLTPEEVKAAGKSQGASGAGAGAGVAGADGAEHPHRAQFLELLGAGAYSMMQCYTVALEVAKGRVEPPLPQGGRPRELLERDPEDAALLSRMAKELAYESKLVRCEVISVSLETPPARVEGGEAATPPPSTPPGAAPPARVADWGAEEPRLTRSQRRAARKAAEDEAAGLAGAGTPGESPARPPFVPAPVPQPIHGRGGESFAEMAQHPGKSAAKPTKPLKKKMKPPPATPPPPAGAGAWADAAEAAPDPTNGASTSRTPVSASPGGAGAGELLKPRSAKKWETKRDEDGFEVKVLSRSAEKKEAGGRGGGGGRGGRGGARRGGQFQFQFQWAEEDNDFHLLAHTGSGMDDAEKLDTQIAALEGRGPGPEEGQAEGRIRFREEPLGPTNPLRHTRALPEGAGLRPPGEDLNMASAAYVAAAAARGHIAAPHVAAPHVAAAPPGVAMMVPAASAPAPGWQARGGLADLDSRIAAAAAAAAAGGARGAPGPPPPAPTVYSYPAAQPLARVPAPTMGVMKFTRSQRESADGAGEGAGGEAAGTSPPLAPPSSSSAKEGSTARASNAPGGSSWVGGLMSRGAGAVASVFRRPPRAPSPAPAEEGGRAAGGSSPVSLQVAAIPPKGGSGGDDEFFDAGEETAAEEPEAEEEGGGARGRQQPPRPPAPPTHPHARTPSPAPGSLRPSSPGSESDAVSQASATPSSASVMMMRDFERAYESMLTPPSPVGDAPALAELRDELADIERAVGRLQAEAGAGRARGADVLAQRIEAHGRAVEAAAHGAEAAHAAAALARESWEAEAAAALEGLSHTTAAARDLVARKREVDELAAGLAAAASGSAAAAAEAGRAAEAAEARALELVGRAEADSRAMLQEEHDAAALERELRGQEAAARERVATVQELHAEVEGELGDTLQQRRALSSRSAQRLSLELMEAQTRLELAEKLEVEARSQLATARESVGFYAQREGQVGALLAQHDAEGGGGGEDVSRLAALREEVRGRAEEAAGEVRAKTAFLADVEGRARAARGVLDALERGGGESDERLAEVEDILRDKLRQVEALLADAVADVGAAVKRLGAHERHAHEVRATRSAEESQATAVQAQAMAEEARALRAAQEEHMAALQNIAERQQHVEELLRDASARLAQAEEARRAAHERHAAALARADEAREATGAGAAAVGAFRSLAEQRARAAEWVLRELEGRATGGGGAAAHPPRAPSPSAGAGASPYTPSTAAGAGAGAGALRTPSPGGAGRLSALEAIDQRIHALQLSQAAARSPGHDSPAARSPPVGKDASPASSAGAGAGAGGAGAGAGGLSVEEMLNRLQQPPRAPRSSMGSDSMPPAAGGAFYYPDQSGGGVGGGGGGGVVGGYMVPAPVGYAVPGAYPYPVYGYYPVQDPQQQQQQRQQGGYGQLPYDPAIVLYNHLPESDLAVQAGRPGSSIVPAPDGPGGKKGRGGGKKKNKKGGGK